VKTTEVPLSKITNSVAMIVDVMFIDRVSGKGNAIGRVRLFLLYSLNQLTFDIDFFSRAFGL